MMKIAFGACSLLTVLIAAAVPTGSLGSSPAKPAHPAATQADIVAGKAIFLQSCSACHGVDAGGDEGPGLKHLGLSTAFISGFVSTGVKGQMPAFGNQLGSSGLRTVAAYVKSLQ